MPDEVLGRDQPAGESPAATDSFQERMRQRLSAERTGEEPAGPPDGYDEVNPSGELESDEVGDGYEDAIDPARQPDDEINPELLQPTGDEIAPTEAILQDPDDPNAEGEPAELTPEHQTLIQRAEDAEAARASMERDYRVKTHKIAAAGRELEESTSIVRRQAEFILGIAEQGVTQFDNINWTELQSKPEEYQRMRKMFAGAIQQRDGLKQQLGGIAQHHEQVLEKAKAAEAEVSKDILKSTVSGWSNELYGKLRGYAVEELSYTATEFDDLTDWRRLRDINSQYQMSLVPKRVSRLSRTKGKQPAASQRERQPQRRSNASGRFQDARQAFHDNPGPKEKRDFFREKLRAERGRR